MHALASSHRPLGLTQWKSRNRFQTLEVFVMKNRLIISVCVSLLSFAFVGCETTSSGVSEVTGKMRTPLTEWDVDVYQQPAGLLTWVLDMDIPTSYEQVARMESSATTQNSNPAAFDQKTNQIVTVLKKRAAKMGANAIVLKEVNMTEEIVEHQSSGYERVRYPDGSIREVEAPIRTSYSRVYKVTIIADSVFLDWDNVWTGEANLTK